MLSTYQYLKNNLKNRIPAKRAAFHTSRPQYHWQPSNNAIERRKHLSSDPLEWMKYYFHEDFYLDFAPHHHKIIELLQVRGRLVLIEIFRDAGKGTILKGYTGYLIAEGLEPYLTRMEHDRDVAINELGDLIREFRENDRIINDYGKLCGDNYGLPFSPSKGQVMFYTPSSELFPRPHEHNYIRYTGLLQIVRGTVTYKRQRLGRNIINDPVEGYTEGHSASHTTKVMHLIKADAGYAGGSRKHGKDVAISVIGTPISSVDVVSTLEKEPMCKSYKLPGILGNNNLVEGFIQTISDDIPNIERFQSHIEDVEKRNITNEDEERYLRENWSKYGLYLENLRSAWADGFELWNYAFKAANFGTDIFMQEIQLQGENPKFQQVLPYWFLDYDKLTLEFLQECTIALGVDPSREERDLKNNDPCALICECYHSPTGHFYWLHVCIDFFSPWQLGYEIYRIANMIPPFQLTHPTKFRHIRGFQVIFETNQYQKAGPNILSLIRELEIALGPAPTYPTDSDIHQKGDPRPLEFRNPHYWDYLKIFEVENTENKIERIQSMRPDLEARTTHVIRANSHQQLGVDQWCNFVGVQTHGAVHISHKIDLPDIDTTVRRCLGTLGHAPPTASGTGDSDVTGYH